MGTQGVNMHCTTSILVAVLIAPACSTSVTYPQYQEYTAAGCSSTTLVKEEFELRAGTQMGSCNKASVATATAIAGQDAPSNSWTKVTCTADTATNGYTYGRYTDSGCTTLLQGEHGGEDKKLEGTGSDLCNDDGPNKFQKYSCGSTSADVGAVAWTLHSAAGCADSDLTGIGFLLVNKCEQKSEDGVRHSEKNVIENGKIKTYKWTNSANLLDCSGTGTPSNLLSVDACQALGSLGWFKLGTMIDGASLAIRHLVPHQLRLQLLLQETPQLRLQSLYSSGLCALCSIWCSVNWSQSVVRIWYWHLSLMRRKHMEQYRDQFESKIMQQ